VYVVVNAEQADEFLLLRSDAVVFILKHLKAAELRSAGQPGAAVPTQPIALGRTQPESSLAQAMLAGRGFWRFAGLVLQLVPRRVRDWGYGVVARNRYRVFGRYDTCLIPGEHTRSRFLDQD
jgi:hypothetical protein